MRLRCSHAAFMTRYCIVYTSCLTCRGEAGERACDLPGAYMATWLKVHTGSAHQVQQVQEKAGESGRHESSQEQERGEEQGADAAGAPAGKEGGAAAGARHERWMASLRKVLPSSSDKIKVERRKQAGLETLAIRRLAAPGARLLKEPAKVEAVACLLHSEVRARFEACVQLLASTAGCA